MFFFVPGLSPLVLRWCPPSLFIFIFLNVGPDVGDLGPDKRSMVFSKGTQPERQVCGEGGMASLFFGWFYIKVSQTWTGSLLVG